METVAYVIVTWNNADIIAGCLDAIVAQTGVDPEIFVLDNASSDATVEVVRQYPGVHLTESDKNLGFARGNNVLIERVLAESTAPWVALINSDAVIVPEWTSRLVEFAQGRDHVAALQGLTLDFYDHDVVDSQHIFVSRRLQGNQYGCREQVDLLSYYPRKVFGVNAAAALYSRAFIEQQPDPDSSFFDERFYMYYEDVDVACRALVAGWDAFFVPGAIAYHMGSVSSKKRANIYPVVMTARNQAAVAYKNLSWRIILRSLPFVFAGVKDFVRQAKHDFGPAGARRVMRAYIAGVFRLPLYARSRRAIRSATLVDQGYLYAIMQNDGIRG
ncbi:MAG: glycosyltransferase family 2 protein [Propionibacteriaceae bacterium]|jgi:GT2 family glycosyltransferase|nr:glycosyltransferase family 2 protein [Propionibacteriaceae bacterium]